MTEPPAAPLEETIIIVGVGLIGGSLGAALRERKVTRHVIGVGRDAGRLESARQNGLIDEGSTDLAGVVGRGSVVVFCTPVDRIVEGVREATRHAKPGTLLTDAGSVKQLICHELKDVPNFIGSHPIAGSHRQGLEAADAGLYEGRTCVLTPLASASAGQVNRLDRLWQAVGMRTVHMSPVDHDRSLAMTSHLPHVVAASLAGTLSDENRPLTGSGFRDTTRIAAGDPDLWTGILLQNAQDVIRGIDAVRQRLDEFKSALESKDLAAVKRLLRDGKQKRDMLNNE